VLKGVTFKNVNSYYNQFLYAEANTILHIDLPLHTTAVGTDLSPLFDNPGTYTITISSRGNAQTFQVPAGLISGVYDFFGAIADAPIDWIEVSLDSTVLALDNFSFVAPPSVLQVNIDVLPGAPKNRILPALNIYLPVAILSTAAFNAADVEVASVRFGVNGTETASRGSLLWDVNHDGRRDLILFFQSKDAGIVCGTTSVVLTGHTKTGQKIQGADMIATIGCGGAAKPGEAPDPSIFKPPF
jgi:hypothetical protein